MLTLVLFTVLSPTAWSQTGGTETAVPTLDLNYLDFFVVKGGWIAYLLIVLSVVMAALAIEHCLSIRRATIIPPEAIDRDP